MTAERWVPGPTVPVEPPVPNRFRGLIVQAVALVVVVGLTLAIGGRIADNRQDPGIGDGGAIDTSDQPTEGG